MLFEGEVIIQLKLDFYVIAEELMLIHMQPTTHSFQFISWSYSNIGSNRQKNFFHSRNRTIFIATELIGDVLQPSFLHFLDMQIQRRFISTAKKVS